MNTSNLKIILDGWNRAAFNSLGISRTILSDYGDTCIVGNLPGERLHCGNVGKIANFPRELIHGGSSDSIAVGAVLDDEPGPQVDDDLDVVIAVGINYGQFSEKSAGALVGRSDWRTTKMRKRLRSAFTLLDGSPHKCFDGCVKRRDNIRKGRFHLVCANFFPWVTATSWSDIKLNRIAETLILHKYGFDDPAERIGDLVARIGNTSPGIASCVGTVQAVVFHGAGNAVPNLGMETSRRIARARVLTNILFTDNLAHGNGMQNAAVLCPSVQFQP